VSSVLASTLSSHISSLGQIQLQMPRTDKVSLTSIAGLQCHQVRGGDWDSKATDGEVWHDCPRTPPQRLLEELVASEAHRLGKGESSEYVVSWGLMASCECVLLHHHFAILDKVVALCHSKQSCF
jgi:hypothetical protein